MHHSIYNKNITYVYVIYNYAIDIDELNSILGLSYSPPLAYNYFLISFPNFKKIVLQTLYFTIITEIRTYIILTWIIFFRYAFVSFCPGYYERCNCSIRTISHTK